MALPTNRSSSSTVAEHVSDHNTLHGQHNELEGHAADTTAHDVDATIAAAIAALVDAAPGTLDTLNELAAALGDDANFASTMTTALAGKAASTHAHAESDVTNLTTDLAGKASTAHHTAHEPGGSDAMAADAIAATASLRTIGTGAAQAAAGNHAHSGAYEPVATAHHARHEPGGADAMAVDAAAGTGSLRTLGTGATQAAAGTDSRLSDTRTPTDGSVTDAKVSASAAIAETKLSLASDAAAGTASRRTLGTGATQAATGNHAHSGTYVPLATIDAAGDLLVGTANDTVGRLAMGSALQVLRVNSGATALEFAAASGGGAATAIFGDGADGVVNFDGTTTVLGLAPSSGVYTLTRDVLLASGSQVSGTAVINCANFRVFCNGTFTVGSTATVHNNGNSAVGTTGGTATASGSVLTNLAGGSGAAGASGGAGGADANVGSGGAGGAGGASSGGPGTGGGSAGGTSTTAAVNGSIRSLLSIFQSVKTTAEKRWVGGAGGRAGNAAASSTGGGGGAGGSILYLLVYDLVVNGTVTAAGGVGGAGTGAGTGAGGGGGGGGGAAVIVYHTKSGTASTFAAATNAAGGTGGAPQGAGKTGDVGSTGILVELVA